MRKIIVTLILMLASMVGITSNASSVQAWSFCHSEFMVGNGVTGARAKCDSIYPYQNGVKGYFRVRVSCFANGITNNYHGPWSSSPNVWSGKWCPSGTTAVGKGYQTYHPV